MAKEIEKSKGNEQMGDGRIQRPNVDPSSTYNINK